MGLFESLATKAQQPLRPNVMTLCRTRARYLCRKWGSSFCWLCAVSSKNPMSPACRRARCVPQPRMGQSFNLRCQFWHQLEPRIERTILPLAGRLLATLGIKGSVVDSNPMLTMKNLKLKLAAMLLASSFSLIATASTCDMLTSSVDDARTKLRRAANESTLEDAKDQARRARNALDDAASAAQDCKCDTAYSEFDDAATRARRARDADNAEEFVENLNRSIRYFNSALEALKLCARQRR